MTDGGRFKRNSWKSKSFSHGSSGGSRNSSIPVPKTYGITSLFRENVMKPTTPTSSPYYLDPPRTRKSRFFDTLRRSSKRPERPDQIPTRDGYDSLLLEEEERPPSRRNFVSKTEEEEESGEKISVGTSELMDYGPSSTEPSPFMPRRLSRSKSYVIEGEESCSSPVIIDVGDMKVECVVEEKHGTFSQASQTEQVPAGLSAETSLELLKKLSLPALRRELDRKKVRYSKNDGKDQLQAKLQGILKMELCPPACPSGKTTKVVIHSEPAEIKRRAQQIAGLAHQTDTPQVLSEATYQLAQVTQEVRVIRQLLEAHVHHLKATVDHNNIECGCNAMLENLCHSLSHYHVRKLESQLQETLSEVQMLQLEKHSLMRAVTSICTRRTNAVTAATNRPLSATGTALTKTVGSNTASCSPCIHG